MLKSTKLLRLRKLRVRQPPSQIIQSNKNPGNPENFEKTRPISLKKSLVSKTELSTLGEISYAQDTQTIPLEALPNNFAELSQFCQNLQAHHKNYNNNNAIYTDDFNKFVSQSKPLQLLIDFGITLPEFNFYGGATMPDGTYTKNYLFGDDIFSERDEDQVAKYFQKYSFLFKLEKQHIEKTFYFLMHNLGLDYESLPSILSSNLELLSIIGMRDPQIDPKMREKRDQMVLMVSYLKKLGLDYQKILSGVGSRCLVELNEGVDDLDLILSKIQKIRITDALDSSKSRFVKFSNVQLNHLLCHCPELLSPNFYHIQEIDRTVQLISRHLITTWPEIKALILEPTLTRKILMERLDHPTFILGTLQQNWKMLTYDFLYEPAEICQNLAGLLALNHRNLKVRLFFLKNVDEMELTKMIGSKDPLNDNRLVLAEEDDAVFCQLIGQDLRQFEEFKLRFFL